MNRKTLISFLLIGILGFALGFAIIESFYEIVDAFSLEYRPKWCVILPCVNTVLDNGKFSYIIPYGKGAAISGCLPWKSCNQTP